MCVRACVRACVLCSPRSQFLHVGIILHPLLGLWKTRSSIKCVLNPSHSPIPYMITLLPFTRPLNDAVFTTETPTAECSKTLLIDDWLRSRCTWPVSIIAIRASKGRSSNSQLFWFGTAVAERAPCRRQDRRVAHQLQQKTQDSLVQSTPGLCRAPLQLFLTHLLYVVRLALKNST